MPLYVGIDPGKAGGIVAIREDGAVLRSERMPVVRMAGKGKKKGKEVYDLAAIRRILVELNGLPDEPARIRLVALERSLPHVKKPTVVKADGTEGKGREGAASVWATAYGFAVLEGILVGLGIPYDTPMPSSWTRAMYVGVPGEGKERSRIAAGRLLPALDLTPGRVRIAHLGLADAGLLALWAMRKDGGSS